MIRLVPFIWVLTPLGVAQAHFFEAAETDDVHSVWTCFQIETKEGWEWPMPYVRICESITGMRDGEYSPFKISDAYVETLRSHILRHTHSVLYGRALAIQNVE
jgi:hypothetical protein